MGLRGYIVKRVAYMFVLVVVVITINFIIFQLMPGDPLAMYAAPGRIKSEEYRIYLEEVYGLRDPLHVKYSKYFVNLITFNFGVSYFSQKSISSEMGERLGNTLLLMGTVTAVSITLGVILGVITAHKRGGLFDSVGVVSSLTTYALPSFWLGMIFLLIFGYYLRWFPLAGTFPREWLDPAIWPTPPQWPQDWAVIIAGRLRHLFLPAFTLIIFSYGGWLLLTRAVMLETLTEDYVVTARAKGLKERTVLFKHALKNASLPLITSAAMSFGFLINGALITEQVFTWRGMGWWIWQSISSADYPALQAIFYVIALCVIIANFTADILYGIIDPRIKYG